MAKSPELTSMKVTIAWMGRWGNSHNLDGEEKHLIRAVGIESDGNSHHMKFYDYANRHYLRLGNSIKLRNFVQKENGIVCTKKSKLLWYVDQFISLCELYYIYVKL